MTSLTGHAIVTGAAGDIGSRLARRLVECGMAVHGWDIQPSQEAEGITPVVVDIVDREAVESAVAAMPEAPSLLVNMAGHVEFAHSLEIGPDAWRRNIDVNLMGSFWCAAAAGRRMKEAGRGAIVQIVTIAANRANPKTVAYAAAKAGALQMARVMAIELAPFGIRVNSISPGPVDGPLTDKTLTPEGRQARIQATPLKQLGKPEDIIEAVVFFASDGARHVTGEHLHVDGGFTTAGAVAS
jgi:3-oxoacyl-[acyl-carrier protein] reductase